MLLIQFTSQQKPIKEQFPCIVRERIRFLRFLEENPKKTRLYVFLKRLSKKRKKKRNPKFKVLDFADFSLHGISTTALKQCMFIIYMAFVVA